MTGHRESARDGLDLREEAGEVAFPSGWIAFLERVEVEHQRVRLDHVHGAAAVVDAVARS
jgi:hypothetical protein